jgi:Zn-finger protein
MSYNLDDFSLEHCEHFLPDFKKQQCQFYDAASDERQCGFCFKPEYYRCVADIHRIIPLSYSSVSDYLTCHHLYYLKAIRGIQINNTMKSSALKRGTLWDKVLQKLLNPDSDININEVIVANEINSRDVAAVRGIYRAYKELGIETEPGGDLQAKIDLSIPFGLEWGNKYPVELLVTGYYDRKYPTYFAENKMSGRPNNYEDPYFIQSQVGVYFMADPNLEYCIMEIVKSPDLKSTGRFKDEDDDEYSERVFQDAISRPAFYFMGWDSTTRRYGRKFYRSEFGIDELRERFIAIFKEIFEARFHQRWYRNDRVCSNILPGIACDMLPICRLGGSVAENNYEIRKNNIFTR